MAAYKIGIGPCTLEKGRGFLGIATCWIGGKRLPISGMSVPSEQNNFYWLLRGAASEPAKATAQLFGGVLRPVRGLRLILEH